MRRAPALAPPLPLVRPAPPVSRRGPAPVIAAPATVATGSSAAIEAVGPARSSGAGTLRGLAGAALPHLCAFGVALAAWLHALTHTHLGRISGHGLLSALPASYYVALAALGAGFVVALARRRATPAWLLAAYVLALVAVLHATTALLYPEPRYAWTFKHLGVVDYIGHFGATDRSLDIYQNWPGFFALAALLQRAGGISLIALAPWAETFFEAAYVAAVVFVLRGVSREPRVVWAAAWLFVLANWLGQDYFAPQSFAYLLSLVLIGVCVRCAPPPRRTPARRRWLARWWRWLERAQATRSGPWVAEPGGAPLAPRTALVVGALLFAAVATSHQLSPLLCSVAVGAFAATTRRVPLWVALAMAAFELCWLALAWPLLASKYHLLDFSPLERPVTPGGIALWAAPGFDVSVIAARASVALVCVLAAAGLWLRRRGGRFDLPLLALMLAPMLVVGVQPYNGEGIFRVYLFALPWLCFLVAALLIPVRRPRVRAVAGRVAPLTRRPALAVVGRVLAFAGVSALLAGAFLFASFGRELVNYVSRQDVAVERAYERLAPRGAAVVYLAPNVPNRLSWRYAEKQVWAGSFSPSLTEDPAFVDHPLGAASLRALEAKLRVLQATQAYVMLGPSEADYVRALGLLPPGAVGELVAALRASPDFELAARDGGAYLFRLRSG
jgi:hypothetical protein